MALAAGTIFHIQASATTGNVNGSGFNPASANFFTDLATDTNTANTASPVVSSASYNFVAGDATTPANYVYVKSGTHWQAGWYPIVSVASNKATLDASVGAVVLTIGATGVVTRNTTVGCTSDNTATLTAGTFGVDYSQTDTAMASSSTATSAGAGSTILFAGSSASMIGNLVHVISGTNFTAGWYEITGESVGVSITTDRAVTTGVGASGVINIGGAGRLNGLEDAFQAMLPASSIVWVKNGSYTLSGAISTANANATATTGTFWIGYNSIRGDACNGANRPAIAAAANAVTLGAFQAPINLSFTTTAALGIQLTGNGVRAVNCKVLNSSTTANRPALGAASARVYLMGNEVISQNGPAILTSTSGSIIAVGNYAHDSDVGLKNTGANSANFIVGNLFEACATSAISIPTGYTNNAIENNTIYGIEAILGIGLSLTKANSDNNTVVNNIFYGLATGISVATGISTTNASLNNDFFNNTTDVTNWTKDSSDLALNPTFTSASQLTNAGVATTSGSVLTDSAASFNGNVTDGVDFLHVTVNIGGNTGCFLINSHTNTTVTVNNSLGTGSTATYYITHGHNFQIGTNLRAQGFPSFTNATNSQTTGYMDIGAVQRQEAGGSAGMLFIPCLQGL